MRNRSSAILLLLLTILVATASADIRKPAVAGTFYPAEPDELRNVIEGHLAAVGEIPKIDGKIIALIVPHAGLVYSGQIAAHSYKLLEDGGVNSVILCGPSHRYRLRGVSVYGPGVQWQTPLGLIDCNDKLCNSLISSDSEIASIAAAHTEEHCLEVQLPYLQTVLDEFTITPCLIGPPTTSNVGLLADALGKLDFDDQTVIVASTDWQHYRPATAGWPMDSLGLDCLKTMDVDRLQSYMETGKVEACGGGSLLAVMKAAMAHGADQVKILKYGDSGDTFGDNSRVVGYVAAVLYDSNKSGDPSSQEVESKHDRKGQDMGTEDDRTDRSEESQYLSESEKKQLLKIARKTIEKHLAGEELPDFEVSGVLVEDGAAFVTLEKQGRLRGCIGHTVAAAPLYQTVSSCAISAAVQDPRFPPVTGSEIDQLHIEISVLTPLTPIESLDEIKVGRDGLMIVKGNYRGLLLPQVATDYRWDRTQFLEHTCQKAGLPPNAYKDPSATIYKFTALVFGE